MLHSDSRAFFFNKTIGWYFADVPMLTFAIFGDAIEIVKKFVKVIHYVSVSTCQAMAFALCLKYM